MILGSAMNGLPVVILSYCSYRPSAMPFVENELRQPQSGRNNQKGISTKDIGNIQPWLWQINRSRLELCLSSTRHRFDLCFTSLSTGIKCWQASGTHLEREAAGLNTSTTTNFRHLWNQNSKDWWYSDPFTIIWIGSGLAKTRSSESNHRSTLDAGSFKWSIHSLSLCLSPGLDQENTKAMIRTSLYFKSPSDDEEKQCIAVPPGQSIPKSLSTDIHHLLQIWTLPKQWFLASSFCLQNVSGYKVNRHLHCLLALF